LLRRPAKIVWLTSAKFDIQASFVTSCTWPIRFLKNELTFGPDSIAADTSSPASARTLFGTHDGSTEAPPWSPCTLRPMTA